MKKRREHRDAENAELTVWHQVEGTDYSPRVSVLLDAVFVFLAGAGACE